MTEDKALQDIIRRIDELREIIEAYMVDIRKDLERLDYLYNTLDTDVYILKNSVTELEKDK